MISTKKRVYNLNDFDKKKRVYGPSLTMTFHCNGADVMHIKPIKARDKF